MTTRRDFLRRSSLALAGGLIVGDAALELLDRLTHRKVWALGAMPDVVDVTLAGVSAGTFSLLVESLPGGRIRRVRFNGSEADRVDDHGVGPNGGHLVRAAIYVGPGTPRVVDGRLACIQTRQHIRPWHLQVEEGRWPSSPIVTMDKPVTREPDRLSFRWPRRDEQVGWVNEKVVGLDVARSTPLRLSDNPNRPGPLVESRAVNYLLHSGDPRRGT